MLAIGFIWLGAILYCFPTAFRWGFSADMGLFGRRLLAVPAPAVAHAPADRAATLPIRLQLRLCGAVYNRPPVPELKRRSAPRVQRLHLHEPRVRHPGHPARLRVLVLRRVARRCDGPLLLAVQQRDQAHRRVPRRHMVLLDLDGGGARHNWRGRTI